ncbi:MAG TPA: hypothetical protein VEU96_27855 [Bryobacteraceae bacterium]|nr:hypothetical protein [Bryobacteraceae bacterium]
MTVNQYIALIYLFSVVVRYPRLKERWTAPLLRGNEWFFSIAAPAGFLEGPGRGILRGYRMRLFIPWLIELPVLAALVISGHPFYVTWLVLSTTLFTRLNFYAARHAAEDRARRFETPEAGEPATTMMLSLQPRTTGDYTNRWVEGILAVSFAAAFAGVGYLYATSPDQHLTMWLLGWTILQVYLQAGLLFLKRAIVSAPTAAPATNTEQYLAWRESLRRFSTWLCDSMRLLMAPGVLIGIVFAIYKPMLGNGSVNAILLGLFGAVVVTCWFEWRRRSAHLEVARRTKPAKLPGLPGVPAQLICFQPDYPMLLLRSATGYTLNLASAPAKLAGLYIAGFAGLCVWLVHLAA